MLFGVIGSCHNDLCCCAVMDSVMHFILNCSKEIPCGLAIEGVVHSSGVNIRNFLIEAPLTGSNLLNLGNQVVEVVLIKDLSIDESALVQNIALLGKGVQHLGCPLTELRGSAGVNPIAYGNDGGQRVKLIVICFPVARNLCKICTSCIFGQFTAFIYIFQVLCHNAPIHIKKLRNGLLCQPNIMILYPYLNAILTGILCKYEEIYRTVADLQLILFGVCHVVSPQSFLLVFFPRLLYALYWFLHRDLPYERPFVLRKLYHTAQTNANFNGPLIVTAA